jgi:hypothetical protein
MRVFYDTEFIEDGKTIDLVSIGMVAEDGREYYGVSAEFSHEALLANSWLIANVLPSLPYSRSSAMAKGLNLDFDHADTKAVKPRWRIAEDVRQFVLYDAAESPVELWAYYGAYDHVALAQLWGRMIDLPEGVPMWTNDLKQEVVRLGNPDLPKQDGAEHNALADARWVRDAFAALEEKESPRG